MKKPQITVKMGEKTGKVYLQVQGTVVELEPDLAKDLGEALYKTGCNAEAVTSKEQL